MNVALEACSSVAERCYYMAGVGFDSFRAYRFKTLRRQQRNRGNMFITRIIQTGTSIIVLLLAAACSDIGPSDAVPCSGCGHSRRHRRHRRYFGARQPAR